ncbi:MAG TPA: helix-turn-helix transcriptional regulator [Pseudobdellovibrionaceae bacterium]|jgi:transcriptional regulator with XRE-family HTH domain
MGRRILPKSIPNTSNTLTTEILGQFVRAKRTQAQLRIDDAAQLCGVSVETLSKIETAKSGVRVDSLFKVLNGLGIKLQVVPW